MFEDMEVSLYGGSQFFEDIVTGNQSELFPVGNKEGTNQLTKVDSQKLSYQPVQVKYNPA